MTKVIIAGRTNGSASNAGGPSGFKRRALVHFNTASIPAGSTVAVVGHTGSGKLQKAKRVLSARLYRSEF